MNGVCRLLARLGRADHCWICPFIGVKRSCRLRAGNDAIDPNATWHQPGAQGWEGGLFS
jgi:hypothetical protein